MKIIDITKQENIEPALEQAVALLQQGGTVVFPTDTVYGLAANACDDHAVRMIYRIKDRPTKLPLPVFVRDMTWAHEVAFIPEKFESILTKFWPGPITAIFPVTTTISKEVTQGKGTVGIRIAKLELVDRLLHKFGYPLATTSANISGEDGSDDPEVFIKAFDGKIFKPDLVLSVGKLPQAKPSTVIDFSTIKPKILRIGVVKPAELEEILNMKL